MENIISYFVLTLLFIGFVYILIKEIKNTLLYQKKIKEDVYFKKHLFGRYLMVAAFVVFLISFTLNVLIYLQVFQSNVLTSNNTALTCFLFIFVYLIVKYIVLPKNLFFLKNGGMTSEKGI